MIHGNAHEIIYHLVTYFLDNRISIEAAKTEHVCARQDPTNQKHIFTHWQTISVYFSLVFFPVHTLKEKNEKKAVHYFFYQLFWVAASTFQQRGNVWNQYIKRKSNVVNVSKIIIIVSLNEWLWIRIRVLFIFVYDTAFFIGLAMPRQTESYQSQTVFCCLFFIPEKINKHIIITLFV